MVKIEYQGEYKSAMQKNIAGKYESLIPRILWFLCQRVKRLVEDVLICDLAET